MVVRARHNPEGGYGGAYNLELSGTTPVVFTPVRPDEYINNINDLTL